MKKHGFIMDMGRRFTDQSTDPYELIHFLEPEQAEEDSLPPLECPDNWGFASTAVLAEQAACQSIPCELKPIEENTVPSWLWKRASESKAKTSETSVRHIFERVAGSAAYAGWKKALFANEAEARNFFDEVRYLLAQRMITLEPSWLRSLGLEWAYGLEAKKPRPPEKTKVSHKIAVHNATIDMALNGRDKNSRNKWLKLLSANKKSQTLTVHFSDVEADWGDISNEPCRGMFDLMAFLREDGSINIETLCHAVRLLTVLLDLHSDQSTGSAIGFCNLASLLMSQSLAYDSAAGRATAAALSALVTAEAYAASAQLAASLGTTPAFAKNHQQLLRSLRNHRRGAYGDRNDYEKISVLPAPLILEDCPDLALVAAARQRWDDVIGLVQKHGLRHTQATSLLVSRDLAVFTESATLSIEPTGALAADKSADGETFRREILPSVSDALVKLGYASADSQKIINFVTGAKTLEGAPKINRQTLRKHGFDDAALEKLENYLPYVNDIHLAFTPWILGQGFCRDVLKLSENRIKNPAFDLLRHLGFSVQDIAAANVFCYGHGSVKGAPGLSSRHAAIFACAADISSEAQIRMAAAVQSFISGDVNFILSPSGTTLQSNEALLLDAWRQGIKSVTFYFSVSDKKRPAMVRQSLSAHPLPLSKLPLRKSQPKAGSRLVSLKRTAGQKTSISPRDKRH